MSGEDHGNNSVTLLDWIAAIVLFLQLPIPLYWFVLHPSLPFWRTRKKAAYITGLLFSWPPVTTAIIMFRGVLFRGSRPAVWQVGSGFALIVLEGWIFWRVQTDLGGARLVGATELAGGGEMAEIGIYRWVRHPRYVGSFLAITGACLIGGTGATWIAAGMWAILMQIAIALEERELHARFGAAYRQYCRRVPRFLPHIIPIARRL